MTQLYAPACNNYTSARSNYMSARNNYTSARNNYTSARNNYTSARNNYMSARNNYTSARNNYTSARNNYTSACNNYTSALAKNTYNYMSALVSPTNEEVHVFARVCLSVCRLAKLLKNACMDLDESCVSTDVRTWTNGLTFKPDLDHSLDARTGLLSPISYRLRSFAALPRLPVSCTAMRILRRENPTYTYWQHAARVSCGFIH